MDIDEDDEGERDQQTGRTGKSIESMSHKILFLPTGNTFFYQFIAFKDFEVPPPFQQMQ